MDTQLDEVYVKKPNNFKKLKPLTKNPDSCLELVKQRRYISLPWFYMKNLKEGVQLTVDKTLHQYVRNLNGVPLECGSIKAVRRKVPIMEDQPCLHLEMQIEYIVFRPKVGAILDGVVRRVDEGQIVCTIYDVITANMYKDGAKRSSRKKAKLEYNGVSVGDSCKFKISSFAVHKALMQLRGKIVGAD